MANLINLSNSILKCFNVPQFHDSIKEVDEAIKNHRKVVVLLFDGMGQNIIRKHLKEDSFIRSHYLTTIDSTFPPTTAAATTAFLSAKYPIETGWMAWDLRFKEFNRNIVLFRNKDYNTSEELPINIMKDVLPYTPITEFISKYNPSTKTLLIQRKPIDKDGHTSLRSGYHKLNKVLKNNKDIFVYFYHDSPDKEMHCNGIDHKLVHKQVLAIDKFVKKVTKKNPDTLFITFADHGHINCKYFDIDEHMDLVNLLECPLANEKRSTMFFLKEGTSKEFKTLFTKYYGEYFTLLSKEEIISSKLYGEGTPHPHFESFLGDYIAISKKEYGLVSTSMFKKKERYPGHHAGGTIEERLIDISIFNN